MDRRKFLLRSLRVSAALIIGDEALDAFERLTHERKSFPGADIPDHTTLHGLSDATYAGWDIRVPSHEIATTWRFDSQSPFRVTVDPTVAPNIASSAWVGGSGVIHPVSVTSPRIARVVS